MAVEEKWKANLEKVAFMKQFPGLLGNWEALTGKTIKAVIPLKGKQGAAVLVCTDGTFTIVPPMAPEPYELGEALAVARALLEPRIRRPMWSMIDWPRRTKTALKSARVEKILGAIHNNLEQIPELKDRLKELVKEWK